MLLISCGLLALVAGVGFASAATLHVPADYSTIQAGIDAAHFGDTVLVAPGSYPDFQIRDTHAAGLMTSCAFLKDGVVVRSEGGSEVTTIDLSIITGPQEVAILALELPSALTSIEGFTLIGPNALGLFIYLCGNVIVRDCLFREFDAGPTTGGGAIVEGNGSLLGCEFVNCQANFAGGIWHTDGHLELIDCKFSGCTNIAVASNEAGAPTSIFAKGCEFYDNVCESGPGGLLFPTTTGAAIISECLFKGNINQGSGGGALGLGPGPRTVENCVFIENGCLSGRGGAIRVSHSATIRGCTFVNNYKPQDSSSGSAIQIGWGEFENNIFFGGSGGPHVSIDVLESTESGCNVLWGNQAGPGYSLSPTDREIDPLLCDVEALDLRLRDGSPCLPDDPLGCGLIGALELGCGTISVESSSWGAIKGLYR